MKTPAQADLQRWSDEVARDPRSLAFLPLARAYRRQGLLDAARHLCVRGLEAYPQHIEGHGLLALLYIDVGNHEKAADEWSIVLRLDPDNFEALRGLGFCHLEADRLSRARQLLERAALQRPADPAVQGALRELGTRQELQEQGLARTPGASYGDDPWSAPPVATPDAAPTAAPAPTRIAAAPPEPKPAPAPAASAPAASAAAAAAPLHEVTPPAAYFDEMLEGSALLGVLLVDAQGLVLAGRLTGEAQADAAAVAALLGSAIAEATRAASHLELGPWRGVLMETQHALLHVRPVGSDGAVLVAARRDAPAGWIVRAAAQAAERAARYAEAGR